jgi:tetratricopeptide (TPR) repeat protein
MSDFRDSAETRGSDEEKNSLLERDWQYREVESLEPADSVAQQRPFHGASSMMELSDQFIAADPNLTSASNRNMRKLLKDGEEVQRVNRQSRPGRLDSESPYLSHFLERARALYANEDFKACLEILHEAHKLAPGNPEILSLSQQARRASEPRDAQLEESELANRIAQCRSEAIRLFGQGRYSDCVARFELLSALEPKNSDLRRYLEMSRELVEKQQPSQLNLPPETQDTTISPPFPDVATLVSPTEPAQPTVWIEAEAQGDRQIPSQQPLSPAPHAPQDPIAEAVAKSALRPPAKGAGNPVPNQAEETGPQDVTESREEADSQVLMEETASTASTLADPVELRAKKLKVACLAGAGLVIGAVLGAWLALRSPRHANNPEVSVQPETRQVVADPPQVPEDLSPPAGDDLQTQAEKAFKQGKLLEANRLCETILTTEADNSFALSLKQEIRERLFNLGNQAVANQRWEEASVAWNNVLKVSPNDREAHRQLKATRAKLRKQEQIALAGKLESETKIQELQQAISVAISSGRYLPPNSGNALELLQQLESASPNSAFAREKLDQIYRDLVALTNRTLQTKDAARASLLVRQIETFFPETSELKVVRENIKAEEVRLAEARDSWMRKAEAAMAAGRYVLPANDSAIAYCNQLLALEPQNLKALQLKKESAAKAGAQAKAWVEESKYDEAKAVYSSLLYLPPNESQLPLTSQELKAEIEKLTFSAYPVIHDHAIGSCTGRLRFNSYQISFVPSTDSKDAFALKISEIVQVEPGDKLKIHFKGKTYRFQTNTSTNAEENRARISEIHKRLSPLVARHR